MVNPFISLALLQVCVQTYMWKKKEEEEETEKEAGSLPVGCLLSSFTDKGDGHVTALFSLDGFVQLLRQLLKMLDSSSHRL